MHGQRDLLDWQDEDEKKEWKERPAGISKQRGEKMLGMVSGVEGTMR
jgi:hypothetical protein